MRFTRRTSAFLVFVFALLPSLSSAGNIKTVRDFGAVGDGKADDSAAFQKAVDSKIGDIVVPKGVYRFRKTVVVNLDKVGPTSFQGTGTATIVMAGPGPAIRFVGTHEGSAAPHTVKENVWTNQRMPTIDGLEIVGAHPQAVGVEAIKTMKLVLTRLTVRKALHAVVLAQRNRNVIVSNCHLYENKGIGLYLDHVDLHQINVTGSHISYNGGGGIVSRDGSVRNLHIAGCDIEANMAADGPPTANILIDCRGKGSGTAEIAITGCTIQHTAGAPDSANIRYIGADNADRHWGYMTIGNNVLSDAQVDIDLVKAHSVTITGNALWKGRQGAIRAVDSEGLVIGPNVIGRNPNYGDRISKNCVFLKNCRDCTITGLQVHDVFNAEAAVILEDCRGINVVGCNLVDCKSPGILARKLTDSRIQGCLIRKSADAPKEWKAIVVEGGGGNLVEE